MKALLWGLLLCGSCCAHSVGVSARGTRLPPLDTELLRTYALTNGFTLGHPVALKATPDGKAVLFLRSGARSRAQHLYELDVGTRAVRTLLTPDRLLEGREESLSPQEKARRERMRLTAKGITSFALSPDGASILVTLSGELYLVARADGRARRLPTGKGTLVDPKLSPDGKSVAYVLDADLYVLDLATGRERRLTTGGSERVTHGLAEFVAQEEMDRFSGYWWSPDSSHLAFEEADAREVELWHVSDLAKPGAVPHPQPYPRAGKANVKVRLAVVPAAGGEPTWVEWDRESFPYLATVRWQRGGPLTLVVQDRRQRELLVLAADERTGKTRELLRERDDAWVNLDQDVPRWLEDGSGFLWVTEAAGAPRLELRDPAGRLVRVLVEPALGYLPRFAARGPVLLSVDEKARVVYFRAAANPMERHLYRVPLAGGAPVPLTSGDEMNTAVFSNDHSLFVKIAQGRRFLRKATVHRADGTLVGELPSVAEAPPFMPNEERLKVGEGDGFYCRIVRPRAFRPGDKLPVLLSVYGGPGVQMVDASMWRSLLDQWRADQGFIVVAIDGRGTPRRGRAWERALRGSFGRVTLDDQVAALQALGRRYPELDLGRVGVVGWSFGGYLSALAVMRRPDVFAAGVAGAPVADWEDYDTHYTERYLGLPGEYPEAYRESSLLTWAPKLERPLLIVHGTSDDNVFFVHALKLSNALFRAGRLHELLPLSGFTHMVPDPTVKARLEERIVRFFQHHLR